MPAKQMIIGLFGFAQKEASTRTFHGALRYAEEHSGIIFRDYSLMGEYFDEKEMSPPWTGQVDGVLLAIGYYDLEQQIQWVHSGGVPAVNLAGDIIDPRLPAVMSDSNSIVQLALDHLADFGCMSFVNVGLQESMGSLDRTEAFYRVAESTGQPFENFDFPKRIFNEPSEETLSDEQELFIRLLRQSPQPVGVLTPNDFIARQILELCEKCELSVPKQVAIVGVGNTPIAYGQEPTITSIFSSNEETGYRAAELVVSMINGAPRPAHPLEIPATILQPRSSTGTAASPDSQIDQVIQLIQSQAASGLKVNDIVQLLGIPRRSLQRNFFERLGRTVTEEITRLRLAHIRQLLELTDFSISRIGEILGYAETAAFCNFFRRHMGCTPGNYRKQRQTTSTG